MAKHRLEDKLAQNSPQLAPNTPEIATSTPEAPAPGKQEQTRSGFWSLRRRREENDNLYERSFRFCTTCGNEVYVLADGCRECGETRSLTPEPAL